MGNIFKKSRKAIKEGGLKTLALRSKGYVKEKVFHIKPITPEDVERKHKELEARAAFEAEKVKLEGEKLQLIADREKLEVEIKVLEEEKRVRGELEAERAKYPPMVDVLFINGCGDLVPHPSRYRVTHQREQLNAYNIVSDEVYYTDLSIEQVKFAHIFVFFRCPYTDTIGEFINLAKQMNKIVLFDVDDLVIDTNYTDNIKYVKQLSADEKKLYDDGVTRMGKTLKLCDGAITSTDRLANELSKYVPEVFINRNTASEKMYKLSEDVVKEDHKDEIRIGYFSGSITHNDDFLLIMPTIIKLLKKYENLRLYVVGELDVPEDMKDVESQIIASPFVDWKELPQLISSVDINIAPLEDDIFNEAKSENKWVEAALVKVPTVASNVGAFKKMITNKETGYLCSDENEWYQILDLLINDEAERERIAGNAYKYVVENCLTIYTAKHLSDFIRDKMKKTVVFLLPSTEISGGIMVALKHMSVLSKEGYDVTIIADRPSLDYMEFDNCSFPVLSNGYNQIFAHFSKGVATMWTTTPFLVTHPKIDQRYYLVQGYEVDFYDPDITLRIQASQSYCYNNVKYVTVSKWCERWLKEKYDIDALYIPNGINLDIFTYKEREFDGKIRILIEGDCSVPYKGVDECFNITNQLDKEKYEVWYMSYNEKPKDWYEIDKFLHRVPYEKVPEVYHQCHILLKASSLESFSYPPLEMMATGGYVVVAPNDGNSEYIKDGYNCLTYEHDEEEAIKKIERIVTEEDTRLKLKEGCLETAKSRNWDEIKAQIIRVYN